MRLHSDKDLGPDEPDDGWVEASSAAPSGTLADVLDTWTVVRRWRGVKALSAAEAIEGTRGQVEVGEERYQVVSDHHDVHATRGEMFLLFHTAQEMRFLARELDGLFKESAEALQRNEDWPEGDKARMRARLTLLNSLRTQFAEAAGDAELQG